jgi:L-asparaginase
VIAVALPAIAQAKPKVVLLATGGTIAGVQPGPNDPGYKAGEVSIDQLIKAVPQLKDIADITGEQIASIGSQTMTHDVWLKLAQRANAVLKQSDVTGVVVTHGTDTLEETGYFLSLVVKSDKPVVLVGSMRPSTAIGADGPANLFEAVSLAINPEAKGRGPLIVINDEIHYAREAQKLNSTQLDTFKSPNRGRAGVMNTGIAYFYFPNNVRHTTKSEFSVEGVKPEDLPRVEIVYSYANFGRDTIDFLVQKGVKGIVLAGVGDGNSTDTAMAGLADAVKKGVAVVRATRTGSGIVARNIEVNDDKMGSIASMELSPQKARILLMLGLMKTKDPKKLQELFYAY